jgi:hypothetical protein
MANIWTYDPYVFKATSSGLAVFSLSSESLINFVGFDGGVSSVWADSQYVYVGTSVSGVYRCSTATVSGATTLSPYKTYPDITSNLINYIHGKGDYICIATASGVDNYKISTDVRDYSSNENVSKCFQTSNGDYYFSINPSQNVFGLDHNLFYWEHIREVTLSGTIPEDDYSLYFEIPLIPSDIYVYSADGGADLRIVDDNYEVVPHYIQSWDDTNPPEIWAKFKAGTQKFYILYGNDEVPNLSDVNTAFRLFDDFEGNELSDKWVFNNEGIEDHTLTIANSLATFRTTNNSYSVHLTSTDTYQGGLLEYYFRRIPGSSNDDLDYVGGFSGGVNSYIGVTSSTYERPHQMRIPGYSSVDGTKYASSSFKQHDVVDVENYQMSEYDGEKLEATNVRIPSGNRIYFAYNSDANNPDIAIDWVRFRSYDPNPPTCNFTDPEKVKDVFESTELHAVYAAGGGHTYTSEKYGVINSSFINDIFVTEGTSSNNNENVIFLATSWGAVVIEENRGDENNCDKRIYLTSS